jgi:polysaccharide deacetylase 2 family uncharacterized protein YibQ
MSGGRTLPLVIFALVAMGAAGGLFARGAAFGFGFGTGAGAGTATDLDRALHNVLSARGMDRASVEARPASRDSARSPAELRIEIPSRDNYADVNAALARAIESAGGRVLDAVEKGKVPERPESIELYVGTRHEITHRVSLRSERPFGEASSLPPRIALVFDDVGYSVDGLAGELLNLGVPLTFAVLPHLAQSAAFVEAARSRGHEVLLHLPMEPMHGERHDPGHGAILTRLSAEENAQRVRRAFDGVPLFVGVSNHMGSRATASAEAMDVVLREMRARGGNLFFLDSRTTPYSVVAERARRAGVPWVCNNIFLDGGDEDPALPSVQTERLEEIARRRGRAIAIGHVRPRTVAAVRAAVRRWQSEGIQLVRVSELGAREAGSVRARGGR